jgi:di/tricarboxylate transporter
MVALRAILAAIMAIVAGLLIAVLDSQPGFDDTGVTAAGLAIAGFAAVVIDGSGRPLRVAMLAVMVGIWIPLVEIAPAGTFAPLLALAFAATGAALGMVALRVMRPAGRPSEIATDRGDAAKDPGELG